MNVCTFGRIRIAKALLEKGAQPNPKNRLGMTALDVAIFNDEHDMAAYLRDKGGVECTNIL